MMNAKILHPEKPGHGKAQAQVIKQNRAGWSENLHYRALFEQTEDCVLIVSFDLRYLAVNPQAVRLLGYSEQELIGKPVSEIMYLNKQSVDKNILGDDPGLSERLMRCKDGRIIPVEIRTTLVYNEDGSPAYVQTIAHDITERKASENSLKYHDRILAVISNAAARLLRSANTQKEIPEILQLLGSTTDLARCAIIKARDRHHFEHGVDVCFEWENPAIPNIDLQKITDFLLAQPSIKNRKFFLDSRFFAENSTDFAPVSIAFIPILEADYAWGFIGVMTPEKHPGWGPAQCDAIQTAANIIGAALQHQSSEERLRASEEHSRTILAALPDLLIRVDQFGNILDYSARKDHPLYLQREKANGKKLSEIWSDEISSQIVNMSEERLVLSGHLRKEFKIPGSDNKYEVRLDPIGTDEILIVIRDISDQARLIQMKSDFINRASHELRTPLTTAILMCELLQSEADQTEKAEYWQILTSELNRQKNLIDRLLLAGRLESGKLTLESEPLDLSMALEESVLAVKSIAKKKNITIKISEHSAPVMIMGDKSGLQQVFINLINNATKFSPAGSLVSVDVVKKDGRVQVLIKDQGLGIPADDMPNLFEQFFRARNVTLAEIPGSGVGLFIVKSIVEELKGKIDVESEVNKGTTFIITFNALEQ